MIPKLLVIATVVSACTRPTSTRVETVRTVVEQSPLCQLPPLPMPATVVGFPVEAPRDLTLALTKADAEELRRELDGLRAWIIAVTTCLETRTRTETEVP